MRVLTAAGPLLAGLLLAGCGGSGGQDLEQPLTALPECGAPPEPVEVERPEGLLVPDGVVLTGTTRSGPLTQVRGWAPLTPVEVRLFYERADVELLTAEDEVFEAELLLTDGDHRSYVKAVAVCAQGSSLDLLVAPESAAGGVPVPSGRATPPG